MARNASPSCCGASSTKGVPLKSEEVEPYLGLTSDTSSVVYGVIATTDAGVEHGHDWSDQQH